MSAKSVTKGKTAERELCGVLSERFGFEIKRTLGQERDGGHDVNLPPFRIECKRRSRVGKLYDWIGQAAFGKSRAIPVVMVRGDLEDWLVVMRLDDWVGIARTDIDNLRH